jgi:NADH:ubiquinone oxidoreductase subunit 2 (subunit N)
MENFLHHLHSGLRWVALLLLLITIIKSFAGMSGNKVFMAGDKKLALFTLISIHLQLVIGLVLYVMLITSDGFDFGASMKDPLMRFFSVEHITGMLVAIAMITIGYSKAKRASSSKAKFKSLAIFFTIGLIIILAMIPWPFMQKFAGLKWF